MSNGWPPIGKISIGGTGSVRWEIAVKNVKQESVRSEFVRDGRYRATGTAETEGSHDFTLSIQVPDGALGQAFLKAIRKAEPTDDRRLQISIPIRFDTREQIVVTW